MDPNMVFGYKLRMSTKSTLTKSAGKLLAISCNDQAYAPVQHGVCCPMEHIQGFTRSRWMPPLGMCVRCIVPAAA